MLRPCTPSRALAVAVVLMATGCASTPAPTRAPTSTPAPGSHAHGTPFGDGVLAETHGFRLTGVQLPERAGKLGTVSVEVLDSAGSPVTSMVRNQTKLLHLYVVRSDLSAFRHLHPEYRDGVWVASATLPSPGTYRVITEFSVKDSGHTDHVVLGAEAALAGPRPARTPAGLRSSNGTVKVSIEGGDEVASTGRLSVRVSDRRGRPVKLGAYLGATGHVTAFHTQAGTMVHLHPVGVPEIEPDATLLTLHTGDVAAGPYVFFVQVRVDGFLHTLRAEAQLT